MDLSTQHAHPFDIGVLALDIRLTHENLTFEIHQGTNCSSSNAMLSGSGLGNDAGLAHFLCQQYLTGTVVYLVGSGMVEVLTLQIEVTTILLAHSFGIVEWRRTTNVVLQQ